MSSKIAWTDETWNPIIGCSKVSPGCENCYAERMAVRQTHMRPGCEYCDVITAGHWNGITALVESALQKPLHWRKPRRIFVCSMGDLFHESVPFETVDRVFAVMAMCPQHTFQVLTKRPDRMGQYLTSQSRSGHPHAVDCINRMTTEERIDVEADIFDMPWPLPNVWLGVTAENQEQADVRIPYLLQCPAEVRFVSVEPMLGEVDFAGKWVETDWPELHMNWLDVLDWVICGGESGPGARAMHPDWVRLLRDQCSATKTAFFFKQWGEWAPSKLEVINGCTNRTNGKYHRIFDRTSIGPIHRLGKGKSTNVIDWHIWEQFPEAEARCGE